MNNLALTLEHSEVDAYSGVGKERWRGYEGVEGFMLRKEGGDSRVGGGGTDLKKKW